MGTLKSAATSIFWILATISLSWTCISMAIKRAEMGEFFAELCRFIMFTGLFFWLLTNGPDIRERHYSLVMDSWRGGSSGREILSTQAQLINLGMQVFQNTMQHINFLAAWNP